MSTQPASPFNMAPGRTTGRYTNTPRGMIDNTTGQFVGKPATLHPVVTFMREIKAADLMDLYTAAGSPGNPPPSGDQLMLHGQLNASGQISWTRAQLIANVIFSQWLYDYTKPDSAVLAEAWTLYTMSDTYLNELADASETTYLATIK